MGPNPFWFGLRWVVMWTYCTYIGVVDLGVNGGGMYSIPGWSGYTAMKVTCFSSLRVETRLRSFAMLCISRDHHLEQGLPCSRLHQVSVLITALSNFFDVTMFLTNTMSIFFHS